LGDRQTHALEDANKFLGKRLTAVIAYKDIDNSPERTFVGVITGVGFSQEQMSLGNIVLTGYSPTILLDGAPHIQSFGGTQPVNMGIIAEEVIRQGIDKSRFDIRWKPIIFPRLSTATSMMKRTITIWPEWLKHMVNSSITTVKYCISENFRLRINQSYLRTEAVPMI
jgi:hypothetical protein